MGKEAMRERAAKGERMHLAPFGYKNARDEDGRAILVPDPETHRFIAEARRLRANGYSIRAICRELSSRGLRTKQGFAISPSRVLALLRS